MTRSPRPRSLVMPLVIALLGLAITAGAAVLVAVPATLRQAPQTLIGIAVAGIIQFSLGLVMLYIETQRIRGKQAVETRAGPTVAPAPPPPQRPSGRESAGKALLLLSLLQEKGRFVDFVMEDITSYSDEQVSAAARVVHQGCRDVIRQAFDPVPVSETGHNQAIELPEGYSAQAFRLVGHLTGQGPPFSGTVLHSGWQAKRIKLPETSVQPAEDKPAIIVPAEVEV
ncbi:MAG: DUF2760 domain-containing protein [Chitinivibrionales bacterium]|nr:DUF2760 domain-containing protein [Chitinivibrionales bacterium]